MTTVLPLFMFISTLFFLRACLVTLGFYKEPILTAFQRYGDEVVFSRFSNRSPGAASWLIFCSSSWFRHRFSF